MSRPVDLKTIEFQSKEKGKIITDPRKFGVELEVISKTQEAIVELDKLLKKSFGFHHDGSVKGQGTGIEIVTPIMSGKVGEEALLDLLEKMNKLKFETNFSCGLHVHHDAQNMIPSKGVVVGDVSRGMNFYSVSEVYFQKKLYNLLKKLGLSDTELFSILSTSKQVRMDTKDPTKGKFNGRKIEVGGVKVYFYNVQNYFYMARKKDAFYIQSSADLDSVYSHDDVSISKKRGKPSVIKNIMYLYTAYTDVFTAMLPDERRNNGQYSSNGRDYCQKLIDRISPFDIERCDSIEDLEKLWLKTSSAMEIAHKKGNQYDESRYYGVNFHSLFAKYGTIEVRWHEGTLNQEMILYWIAIHQHMIRQIEEERIYIGSMKPVLGLFKLEDKIEYFFKIFKFPKHLEKYMRERLEFFTINK